MSTAAPAAPRADACPEPEQLAAYIDGGLPPAERTTVERHLAECGECRDIVGDAFAERPASAPARPRMWGRLAVAGGLVAAAAVLTLIVRTDRSSVDWKPMLPGPSSTRLFEARVSVMSEYAPPPPTTRGTGARDVSVDARLAADQIDKRASEQPTAKALHDAGLARLLTEDLPGAIERLRRAAETAPNARVLSDLSAALLVDAGRRGDRSELDLARGTARLALEKDPSFAPALFNAALIEEQAATPAAVEAWRRYLQSDGSSGWADEARRHLDTQRTPRN